MTDNRFRKDCLDSNLDEFLRSGEEELKRFERIMKDVVGIDSLSSFVSGRCVADIGSGVGRIAAPMSRLCKRVYCVDIAQSYLDTLPEIDNMEKVLVSNVDEDIPIDEKCRLVYSIITFQHNPPEQIKKLIKKACRMLSNDGIALLHIPSKCLIPHRVRDECIMQMNFLPENDIRQAAGSAGCRVIGKHPMRSSGQAFEDYMFVMKPGKIL